MRFYFTLHPSDLTRGRLLPGTHGLLVASSLWRNGRLRVRRPPAGVLASLALDSGGFTAARKWGQYPWSAADYARWARTLVAERPVDWGAIMDYACEPGVNRETWATNQQRIAATITQARRCLDAAPELPWLPVVQGYTVDTARGWLPITSNASRSCKTDPGPWRCFGRRQRIPDEQLRRSMP
jgi:hypothetical protein